MADEVANLTLEILKRVQADLAGLRTDVSALTERVSSVEGGLSSLRSEMTDRFNRVDGRFDELEGKVNRQGAALNHLESETVRGFQFVQRQLDGHRALVVDRLRDHEVRITSLEDSRGGR